MTCLLYLYCFYSSYVVLSYSSAPELLGLLSELKDAFEQLESKVNPLVTKIRERENAKKGGTHYMEVKQQLLLSYCQAITFYLLLKSEGQPVRDHPVISRLVEIKNLLDKMKELDRNLPPELEAILNKDDNDERVEMVVEENNGVETASPREAPQSSVASVKKQETLKALEASKLVEADVLNANEVKSSKLKHQLQDIQVGLQSMEMLKVRAALEEKLKQKGVFSSMAKKHDGAKKRLLPVNRQLETLDDFDDDAREDASSLRPCKLSKIVTPVANKVKVIAGDDDLPKRDDIGERRRKFELRVLAGAGIKSVDGVEDEAGGLSSDGVADDDLDGESDSDLEFYKQAEQEHAAKRTVKAEMYSRPTKVSSMPETPVDGKRQISYQMEKNRGLTRSRNKLTKNPRKKYRTKHQKAVQRRKGQVREVKKPTGPYGGESTGLCKCLAQGEVTPARPRTWLGRDRLLRLRLHLEYSRLKEKEKDNDKSNPVIAQLYYNVMELRRAIQNILHPVITLNPEAPVSGAPPKVFTKRRCKIDSTKRDKSH
ncbi:hypothetical protein M9H77_09294 [Catharanthus roseus]|uniref:Uncharacterized protein n=1 Tax=Catharanthus roseus TaxID=4058 RepID=A0ACC0C0J5_CATRO|nr:hypothetical protein M9H77_09294 [Catharanthus roseus]